jgi:uncharacterized protein YkwD
MKQPRRLYIGAALLAVLLVALVVSAMNWTQASAAPDTHTRKHTTCWGFFCFFPPSSSGSTATPTLAPTRVQPTSTQISTPAVPPTPTPVPSTPVPTSTTVPSTPVSTSTPVPSTPIPTPTVGLTPISTPVGDTGYTDSPDAAQAVLDLINQERASMNLPALKMDSRLIQSAHLHNIVMFQANTLSHQLSGEAGLGARISAQGVVWRMVAENIGYGWGDAMQTAVSLNKSMFAEQPPNDGHRQNILSSATVVGIDVIVDTHNSKVWLTVDFAQI